MPETIEFQSRVGSDGVLDLHVSLGESEAGADVVVTIRAVSPVGDGKSNAADWHRFVEETYGSCAGLGLERQPQGEFEQREALE
ncbi:MAG: hypothetical protein ABSH20_22565 [Tepidisphaeraceae bacterium]|jgi:hypothetical protein